MSIATYLSPKLPLVSDHGFALRHSLQASYRCEWHMHDCAMLLWPRRGNLRSVWMDAGVAPLPANARGTSLTRGSALLLPPGMAHATRSGSEHQQHGELYLAPDLVEPSLLHGPRVLDRATLVMLDALLEPGLATRGAEHLVSAVMAQIGANSAAVGIPVNESIPRLMIRRFSLLLELDENLPTVDAVAEELGVSMRQLQRLCLRELGMSPVEARRRLQAARARALLAQGLSFASVSTQLGFSSSGHLGRLLRGA